VSFSSSIISKKDLLGKPKGIAKGRPFAGVLGAKPLDESAPKAQNEQSSAQAAVSLTAYTSSCQLLLQAYLVKHSLV
jgi:hypothetical protein